MINGNGDRFSPQSGVTEEEFLAAISAIADKITNRFRRISFYEKEDLYQCCALWGLEALARYDHTRDKLAGFLYRHCLRRAINLIRDKVIRRDVRSTNAKQWNERKAALGYPAVGEDLDVPNRGGSCPDSQCEDSELSEMLRIVDENLDVEKRRDWLRIRAGVQVPKARRVEIEEAVKEILAEYGLTL